MVKRYELTDRQWYAIADLLPGKPGDRGRTGADNRAFVNGVLWVLRSGARWSELPARYGPSCWLWRARRPSRQRRREMREQRGSGRSWCEADFQAASGIRDEKLNTAGQPLH